MGFLTFVFIILLSVVEFTYYFIPESSSDLFAHAHNHVNFRNESSQTEKNEVRVIIEFYPSN